MSLIKKIQLPNGRSTTNLGFGCAGILRLPTRRTRQYLLKTAVEEGITHFDLARIYGLGTAEGIVGCLLKSFGDRITLATKFGLSYETPFQFSLKTQTLARWLLNWSPAIKNKINRLTSRAVPSPPLPAINKNYSIDEMERSLNLSLQQLQTDFLDLFFIHAPAINDFIPNGMGEALQQLKRSGKIGAFGISANRADAEHFLRTRPDICGEAIQYHYSILTIGSESHPLHHAFTAMIGVVEKAHHQLCKYLSANKAFRNSWSYKLGIDLGIRENVGIIILAVALVSNPKGMVVFFTSNAERLRHIVRRLSDNILLEKDVLDFRQAVLQRIHDV
jgi:D-threo-aldose 1-dehydrogenase